MRQPQWQVIVQLSISDAGRTQDSPSKSVGATQKSDQSQPSA